MIDWTLDGPIATLTLDRGTARNAIATASWWQLADAAQAIAESRANVLVLRSAMPGIFSAGADLAEFRRLVDDPVLRPRFRDAMGAAIEGIATLPIPVIAAVDGGCFGAAVALCLACDVVIAGDPAVFATTPAKLGLSYPAADVARLRARVGDGAAAHMLFTGEPIDADEALRIGLAHVRAPDAAMRARKVAEAVAANVPHAVRSLKAVLRDPSDEGHAATFDDAFGSIAFRNRLDAFLAGKR